MTYFLLYHKINHLKMGPYSPCSLRFLARAAMCLTHALKCQVNSGCENIFALFCFVLLFFFLNLSAEIIDAKIDVRSV